MRRAIEARREDESSPPPGTSGWVILGVCAAALAASTFAITAFGALAPELRTGLGLSRSEIGLLTSLVFLGAMGTSRWAGKLTDTRGARPVLAIALVGVAGATAVAARAPNVASFMGAVLLVGVFFGAVNPPTNAAIVAQVPWRPGFLLSTKQSGVPIGGLLAGIICPAAALAVGWRWALLIPVAGCLGAALSTLFMQDTSVALQRDQTSPGRGLQRSELLVLGFFGFVMSGSQWTLVSYLTLFLTQNEGLPLTVAGLALGLAQASGIVGRLLWGWLSDAPGQRLTILVGVSAASLLALLGLASNVGGLLTWVAVAIAGLALIGWNGAYYALLADRAGPSRVGKESGTQLIFVFCGSVVLPPAFGLVADVTGAWWPLWVADAGMVGTAGLVLWHGLRTAMAGQIERVQPIDAQ